MRLANFPLKVSKFLAVALLLAGPVYAAQLINVTGNGVELTYVSVDCAGANETGIVVAGTTFVGKQISVQNCAAGGFTFNESATLTNSLAISDGADITIANTKTVTGTYNLFGDAAKAGSGTYTPDANTKWGAAYADRIDAGTAIAGLHTSGSNLITGGDAGGNGYLYGNGVDIGANEVEQSIPAPPSKKIKWKLTKLYTVP